MVNFKIPNHYTNSPSSYSNYGTPQVTINKDATLDLDSSNAFEGPEKLLEVWFSASPESLTSRSPDGLKDMEGDARPSQLQNPVSGRV